MAIQIDVYPPNPGPPFTGSYFRVVAASITRTNNEDVRFMAMIELAGYETKPESYDAAVADSRRYFVRLSDVESMAGDTFFSKCYAWVMALPEMAGSVAV
jgi:hypothetical protein